MRIYITLTQNITFEGFEETLDIEVGLVMDEEDKGQITADNYCEIARCSAHQMRET